jgi:hypothetical protein
MRKDIASLLKVGSIIVLSIAILGYAYFRTRALVAGAKIELYGVTDGMTVTEPYLELSGRARNASELTIDDRAVETDQDGNFKEPLILLSGYNIITIKADDKFGKHLEKKYRVVLEESSPPATKPVPEEQDADVSADTLGAENVEPTKNANTDDEEQTNENTQIETEID